jgi:hypothetical protein
MTAQLEEELRAELRRTAAATRTAPDALGRIAERAERRPPVRPSRALAVAAVVVVALAAGVALRLAPGGDGQTVVADQPPQPPSLSGTVQVEVLTSPCNGDCVDGHFRFSFGSPQDMVALLTGEWHDVEVLADGRYLTGSGGGATLLVDPASGAEVPVGAGEVQSVAEETRGTVVVLAFDETAQRGAVLRRVDPGTGAVAELAPLADDLVAHALAVGPDGQLAVLADVRECCLNRPVLVVLDRDGNERQRIRLGNLLPEQRSLMPGRPGLSWGRSGLIAISGTSPEPLSAGGGAHPGWTTVLDPTSGRQVAQLDGWQGLAWSPDGDGLLVARRTGRRTSELAVLWGPALTRTIQAGTTGLPVVPRYWSR